MFFSRTTAVVVLRYDSLEVMSVDADQVFRITLPADVVAHLELQNRVALSGLIQQLLTDSQLKPQHYILLLGEDTLFTQEVALPVEQSSARQSFTQLLPFEESNIAVIELIQEQSVVLIGAPLQLYQAVHDTLAAEGWKCQGIFPAILFQDIQLVLSVESLSSILDQAKQLSVGNFLGAEKIIAAAVLTDKVPESAASGSVFKQFFLLAIALVLLAVSAYVVWWQFSV